MKKEELEKECHPSLEEKYASIVEIDAIDVKIESDENSPVMQEIHLQAPDSPLPKLDSKELIDQNRENA